MSEKRRHHRPDLTDTARKLRQNSTKPEQRLWALLRNRQIGGLRFRRQHAVGPFVMDFYCAEASLAVEVDGRTHIGQRENDEQRSAFLHRKGFHVVRVTNDDVRDHPEAVVHVIARTAGLDW